MENRHIRYIDPLRDLGALLLNVEKPARYAGGEYGRLCGPGADENTLKTLIAFPDLYEIGMSNQAVRILYNGLNRMDDISCDRAFAPAPDFEELLRSRNLPLYGLDTGISLKDTDILMFTLGYELGITGVFSMLDISGIPLRCRDRGDEDPVIIMGGPCVSNPLPYAAFIDAFWIGEAEGGFFELASSLREIKKSGGNSRGTRKALLERLLDHPSVWAQGKGRAFRAVDGDFALGKNGAAVFPVPSMKVVHHHGSVEIMRGCPNGCRFCHAGYWYRPMRQKDADIIQKETEAFVHLGGYREISLSSLSSGDYQHLDDLIENLNAKFQKQNVSFQLPSLRVSSFSLKLLEKISEVRKSGLTFAVETPADFWQMAINKEVSGESVVSILREAKRRGWRGAKFYFMLGLPLEPVGTEPDVKKQTAQPDELMSEEQEIAAFIEKIARQTGMHFNINVGTFVPKPHTPFQWAAQMGREESAKKLDFLRARLKPQGHKVGIQDPLISIIEGIASRGDDRAGDLFEEAYRMGCRLDSWTEYLKRDVWELLLEKHKPVVDEFLCKRDTARPLPWSCISPGISGKYFDRELIKSQAGEITLPCIINCNNPCGACNNSAGIVENMIHGEVNSQAPMANSDLQTISRKADPDTYRIIFSFAKQRSAIFQPHLGLIEIFSMAFIRANIPVLYSQGFNPLPRLDIASPLSLGIRARGEIATVDTEGFFEADSFKCALNNFLPDGLTIIDAMNVRIPSGGKKYSVSSLLWGFSYEGIDGKPDFVKAGDEKTYRLSRTGRESSAGPDHLATAAGTFPHDGSLDDLERLSVLAGADCINGKNVNSPPYASYFDVYSTLYPVHCIPGKIP